MPDLVHSSIPIFLNPCPLIKYKPSILITWMGGLKTRFQAQLQTSETKSWGGPWTCVFKKLPRVIFMNKIIYILKVQCLFDT